MNFKLFHLIVLLRVTATVGEEIAVGAVLFVGALGEGSLLGVLLIGGEDFFDFLRQEGIEGLAALLVVVADFFFLACGGISEFDDA